MIDDHGLKRGFLQKWIVREGISKVIAMRLKRGRLQLKLSIKQFTQELCRFGYSEKMTEQATLNENVSENDLNL